SKLEPETYPRRLWGLVGFPGSGKSTFAARRRARLLAIEADHRFGEVAGLAGGDVYRLSDTPADHVSPEKIAARLRANMAGAGVATIVVDSLTAIMAPIVTATMLEIDAGQHKNKAAAWREKALAMRLLQDSITGWGTDVLWIYHLQSGRDANAQEVTTATVSRTELARLTRSINLQLEIAEGADGRRSIKVIWARRGRSGLSIDDPSGSWEGMPERIEEAVYGGLSRAEQDALESATPRSFAGPEQAIAWGVDCGAFDVLQHSRNAYDKLKREAAPGTASEMWTLWIADCLARRAEALEEVPY
ncbi:MAG: AAA family ATPase, partial [Anaerolineales bacterium]|nr:AAA family ATPase [Anaerolineales bacterium]